MVTFAKVKETGQFYEKNPPLSSHPLDFVAGNVRYGSLQHLQTKVRLPEILKGHPAKDTSMDEDNLHEQEYFTLCGSRHPFRQRNGIRTDDRPSWVLCAPTY